MKQSQFGRLGEKQGAGSLTGQDALLSGTENQALFTAVARRYDLLNHLLSLGLDKSWRRRAAALLAQDTGRYLDVGCGTGDSAREILRQFPRSRIVGIDPCEAMLARGRRKIKQAGEEDRIQLISGDVLALDFPPASFTGALSAFCLRNVTDHGRALREIRKVLRPGGRLVILELTDPPVGIRRWLFRAYGRSVLPLLARLSKPSAYRYLAASMAAFPAPERIGALLQEAGFREIGHQYLTGGLVSLFTAQTPPPG
jgi:demethylmenaquinone methyltransferase / 2-methoxy-6-polyprenyl-1,4-benzoquinol methylase